MTAVPPLTLLAPVLEKTAYLANASTTTGAEIFEVALDGEPGVDSIVWQVFLNLSISVHRLRPLVEGPVAMRIPPLVLMPPCTYLLYGPGRMSGFGILFY